jgi:hypothetical protein
MIGPFVTVGQVLAHGVGDFVLQSDWMATEKAKRTFPALCHVCAYTLPFLLLTQSVPALLAIAGSHFAIDRWRLTRYLVWAKNWLGPNRPWKECQATGYPPDRPVWLTFWLLIIVDNIVHICCNALALAYL